MPRITARLAIHTCLTNCVLLLGLMGLPLALHAASISYLPGVTSNEVMGTQSNLSALTWELPHGFLVVDRLIPEPGQATRFGEGIQPRYSNSDWFLVNTDSHDFNHETSVERLTLLGTIHIQDDFFYLVEVPGKYLEAFTQLPFEKTRIPMTPPPPGWDSYPHSGAKTIPQEKITRDDILGFVDQIDPSSYYLMLQELCGATSFWYDGSEHTVSTRYYNSTDNDLIADYLGSQLADYGYIVSFEEFYYNSHLCRNVIATKPGATQASEFVILGGHYDSTSPVHSLAPGAEDNGSGSALVMEVARIAANRQFERSIQFVLFDSEEQGLNGSYHFVDEAVTLGRNIVAAIIADMVSWYSSHYAVIIEGDEPYEWLMGTMENNVADFTPLDSRKDYYSWGSDHVPFQQAGIASFLAIDWDWNNYPHYHQTTDTWSNVMDTAEIATQIAKACAATLAEVAVLQPVSTSVADQVPDQLPRMTAFPNPFNPQVTINFSLPASLPGRLVIYDLAGRRLATLRDGLLPAGDQAVVWDGRDTRGNPLGSGIYLCRLETQTATTSLKLNLAR